MYLTMMTINIPTGNICAHENGPQKKRNKEKTDSETVTSISPEPQQIELIIPTQVQRVTNRNNVEKNYAIFMWRYFLWGYLIEPVLMHLSIHLCINLHRKYYICYTFDVYLV